MSLPPFAITHIGQTTVLTPLVDGITATNANWLKGQILAYQNDHQPHQLWLNMSNIQRLDRLGLGVLLSLNTHFKPLLRFGLMGLNEALETQLQKWSYGLEIWHPPAVCPVCSQADCVHVAELLRLPQVCDLNHWQPEAPPPETTIQKVVRILTGQLVPAAPKVALPPGTDTLWEPDEDYVWTGMWRHYLQIVFSSMVFVGFAAGLVWIAVEWDLTSEKKWRRPLIENKIHSMSEAEMLEHFDRNGDGVFNRKDWKLLSSHEKLQLINHGFQSRRLEHKP